MSCTLKASGRTKNRARILGIVDVLLNTVHNISINLHMNAADNCAVQRCLESDEPAAICWCCCCSAARYLRRRVWTLSASSSSWSRISSHSAARRVAWRARELSGPGL